MKNIYQRNNSETTFLLDKKRKKNYTESNQVRLQLGAFDDDTSFFLYQMIQRIASD